MPFDDVKGLLASRTFWGIVLMVVGLFNKPLAEALDAESLTGAIELVFGAVGAVLAIVGRVKAVKSIRGIV
jgi:hypothetical protein